MLSAWPFFIFHHRLKNSGKLVRSARCNILFSKRYNKGVSGEEKRRMQKEKILVIDDEEFILQLAQDILTRADHEIKTVSDGNKGLELLETEKFDLLLTDIRMPDISGLDVIRHVRARNREMPIIIITGHGTLDTAINAMRLGAQGFLLKPFTPEELRTAVAEALEKTRLLNENIRMRALMPLFEVSKEIISETDTKRLVRLIIDIAVQEARADKAWLAFMDEESGKLELKVFHGLSSHFEKDFGEHYSENLTGLTLKGSPPFLITAGSELPSGIEEMRKSEEISSGICMPLSMRGNVIGLLCICRKSSDHLFTQSDVELLSVLSGQAAAAIENARLYEKLEQSYLSMIVTLSAVVEARDLYTDKHMKDIAEYSVEIARKLRLPDRDVENIKKAALLHDLGKICVPDHILMKPDKLSDEELAIIKRHPEDGAKIIGPVEPLKHAKEIIKYHQECFDGSGYPDGLKGENIPLGARIIGVADAFGAMTTDRPYRKALSVADAVKELKKFSGIQFDPHIVEIFISMLEDKGVI
jgi:response regulator RpfG family c-di-GMP phosphodiesterase